MSAVQEVIPAADVTAARDRRISLIEKMADKYHLDPRNMMATLKATAFKGDVSTEQMAALLIVADQHNLNPWLKEIYAFPSRQGIVPIVGIDGWARLANEHPAFDGMEFALSGEPGKEAYTCTIYRKDRAHPISVTEYMAECYRPTDPWKTHPLRMLRHKAMIQCARLAFSFAGIYDPDEGERVLAAENAINVTPFVEPLDDIPEGTTPEKISPKKLRELCEGLTKAVENNDSATVFKLFDPLTSAQRLFLWGELRSYERTGIKKLYAEAKKADAGMQLDAWSISLAKACTDDAALSKAFASVAEAYAANGVTELPEAVVLAFDECRQSMGGA